jgi:putative ABC transport system ATP-binding protein
MQLVCRDLTVEYASGGYRVRPIEGLGLEVESGEIALLLGASGCGKTTLLSVIAAILRPTNGSVRLGELEVTALSPRELNDYRRSKIGIVFQAANLIKSLSAVENVELPLVAAGVRGGPARKRATTLLERVGLGDRLGHRPGELSGGQQQRVAIARALAHDPPVLLADEPTAHLDYIQVESVLLLLRDVAAEGRTVLVATHDERLLPLADRVVALSPEPGHEQVERRDVSLEPGDVLFEQGDLGDHVYVVEEGEIEIVRIRDDGSEELVTRVGPGGYFGELAPMFGIRRSATARASTSSRLQGLSLSDFRRRIKVGRSAGATPE